MTLEILICTIDSGIAKVPAMLMPMREGIRYLVSWQQTGEAIPLPNELLRDDVRVVTIAGKGLSRNRNNAIANAQGDVCLIADDDLEYYPEALRAIVEKFETDSELAIATFRYDGADNAKNYSESEFDLRCPVKGYYVASIEIAFRRSAVQGRLWFDENFGLGAPELHAAEEAVFVHDALSMGMKGRYFPLIIVKHCHATTGIASIAKRGVLMGNAAYLYVAKRSDYMWLRALLLAWRVSRKSGASLLYTLRCVIDGINYAKKIRK